MRIRLFCCFLLVWLPAAAGAQSRKEPSYQIFGGYTRFSNSFNGVPGSRHGLNGWEAAVGFPPSHHLRFVLDYVAFGGKNLGAPQHGFFGMAGLQYERHFGREGIFAEGLVGDAGLNKDWYSNAGLGTTASFTEFAGGGADTPITHSLAFRIEGGVQHTNFALLTSKIALFPYYRPAGLPDNFARVTAGIVWTHYRRTEANVAEEEESSQGRKESELVYEGEGSFGHYHVFAYTWWSYLHVAGIEYDRHTWGRFADAQLDYVGEILPVVMLQQPKKTDAYGDDLSPGKLTLVPGLGITPIGLRMTWRHGKDLRPFYMIKGGMIFFTKKALSRNASYENFTLQQSVGLQVRLSRRWDVRLGAGDFHFSNAFVVPSDPGIDEMMYNIGLCYHLGKTRWFF